MFELEENPASLWKRPRQLDMIKGTPQAIPLNGSHACSKPISVGRGRIRLDLVLEELAKSLFEFCLCTLF